MNYKPNVVVVMADDAGLGDVELYNENCKIPTPNIKEIGSDGGMFSTAYSPSSVCTQTRYGLLTGKYHFKTSYRGQGVVFDYQDPMIDNGDGLQRALSEEGYNTYCSGKWHLGMEWRQNNNNTDSDELFRNDSMDFNSEIGDPSDQGFDRYYGIRASHDMPPYCFIEDGHVVGKPTGEKQKYYNQQREGPESPVWNDYDVGKRITQKALSYITEASQKDEPFFLYVPTSAPHKPCLPPEFIEGTSGLGKRADMICQFDWTAGAIREQIQSLGIMDETLLIVTSDHGPSYEDNFNNHDPVNGLRGGKATLFEGGVRVPLVFDPPKQVDFNSTEEPVSLIDIAPTVLDIINADYPEDEYDGRSWLDSSDIRPIMFEDGEGDLAIRCGRWKFISEEELLFDLEEDPQESTDVSDSNPAILKYIRKTIQSIKNDDSADQFLTEIQKLS